MAMNALPPTVAPPLLDQLGARWLVGVPATAVAWDVTTGLAGFALGDGTLALAHPVWDGAPALRPREGGGATLVPGTAPAPPAARVQAHRGTCLAVAADPDGGFLTGGADGRVTCVQPDGSLRAVAHFDGKVSLVVTGPGHWRACAVRSKVHRLGGTPAVIDLAAPVTALALDPSGARLAIGHQGGVTLWAGGDTPLVLPAPGPQCGIAWSADQTRLASFSPDGTLHAWTLPDAAPLEIAVGAPANALDALPRGGGFVAGVAGRVICWQPPSPALLPCGVRNQAAVTRLAAHPHRHVLAAGYANGTVVLCQPGSADLLLLRAAGDGPNGGGPSARDPSGGDPSGGGPGGGGISALAFSPFGGCLAIGTDGGEIGVLALPDMLFRDQARPS
jgi:WD40 repeat protein